ncbi:hypothetical protein ACVMYR_20065 [Micromonospora sp. PTRAS2]|uniref:hypothetical protein n=1 Tax=unclassified Micromonospora TaxID=2617518 RepID=UPI0011845982|nr:MULTISPECIES: hypothetical protein [unclassified Micromonospora]
MSGTPSAMRPTTVPRTPLATEVVAPRPRPGRPLADLLPAAERRADWRHVRGLHRQHVQFADGGGARVPAVLREALADAILDVSSSYAGHEDELVEHGLAVLADVEGHEIVDEELFRAYYEDDRFTPGGGDDPTGRRQPGLFEALVETCRRRRDARGLRDALRGTGTSGLLIGSTSYGRFHNVRGNRNGTAASDLDFVVVVDDPAILGCVDGLLATALPGVPAADLDRMRHRAEVFTGGLDDGRTVFSHKLRLWADGAPDPMLPAGVAASDYLVSLHFLTRPVLDYVLVASTPRLRRDAAGARRTVHDYREAPVTRRDHHRTFAGRSYQLPLDTVATEGGHLTSPRVYYIDDFDSYCPGFFQTMLLPRPDVLWDGLDVAPALDQFQRKISERVRYEADRPPHAMVRQSFAHVRRDAFAPRVIRLLDG